jgi:cytosine/adenosine deaminase-related metal-dependent hydrolase
MDNVEYFESLGILQSNTCLAHCIWLNPAELDLLERRRAKVLHCPSSNLKLGSGIARIPDMISRKITVGLGSDGAPCNNTLDMFQEMRLAALLQKPLHGPTAMNAETVFEIATLGGATALGLEREIGSIEPGKRADIVLLDLARVWNSIESSAPAATYSSLVYSGSPENVRAVMVDGVWLYRDGVHKTLDEQDAMTDARRELRKLLGRM